MATLNLGRIKPVFRGAYSGSTAYVVDDIVTHGDESFICIQAHGAGTQATSVTAYWTKLAAKGTDGTDVGTTITTQGDILYRDGSGLQRLAKPASNKYLQNTSGGVVSWESLSSDFVKIATVAGTGSSGSLVVDNCFTATYRNYIIWMSLYSDTATQQSFGRVRTGGASGTSKATGYYMAGLMTKKGNGSCTTGCNGTWDGTNYECQENIDGLENRPSTLIINIFDPAVAARDTVWQGNWGHYDGTHFRNITSFGTNTTAGTAVTGWEQYIGSGNWRTQTKITVYGIKE